MNRIFKIVLWFLAIIIVTIIVFIFSVEQAQASESYRLSWCKSSFCQQTFGSANKAIAPRVTGTVTMRDMVAGEVTLRGQTEREAYGSTRRGVTRDVTAARIAIANRREVQRERIMDARIALANWRATRKDATSRWMVTKDQINTGIGVASAVKRILGR